MANSKYFVVYFYLRSRLLLLLPTESPTPLLVATHQPTNRYSGYNAARFSGYLPGTEALAHNFMEEIIMRCVPRSP